MLSQLSNNLGCLRFWSKAVETSNYIRTRLYTKANRHGIAALQSAYNKQTNLSRLRDFLLCCICTCSDRETSKQIQPESLKRNIGLFSKRKFIPNLFSKEHKLFISEGVRFHEEDLR